MEKISSDDGSGVIALAADKALLGDWAAAQGKRRWWRQQGSGSNGGTVAAAAATAVTNIGNNGSGTMEVAAVRALLVTGRQQWDGGSSNCGDSEQQQK